MSNLRHSRPLVERLQRVRLRTFNAATWRQRTTRLEFDRWTATFL